MRAVLQRVLLELLRRLALKEQDTRRNGQGRALTDARPIALRILDGQDFRVNFHCSRGISPHSKKSIKLTL